jgi:G3E family GTPase
MTAPHIPVVLLTGFLGSGKTTLLNRLLAQPDMADTLVIINEYGDASLDHLLVSHTAEQPVVELAGGCVCCTLRGDLAQTLRDAHWRFARADRRQFERVVIETTGLADPAPLLRTLIHDERISARYRLACTLTLVDACHGADTLVTQTEALRQIAAADRLLVSKSDLAGAEALAALRSTLAQINPFAPQVDLQTEPVDSAMFAMLPARPAHFRAPLPPDSRHDVRADSFCFARPIPRARFDAWLADWPRMAGPGLLRMKALFDIEGEVSLQIVHGVQHTLHPPIPLPAASDRIQGSTLVFITRGIAAETLRAYAEKLAAD